jgi:NAD(P)-dependent dehydrogenase (short-subunit alcohol dehydrogenase family)
MKLLNKNAIITGGNQGFGLAVAEAFMKEGANVVISARNEEKLKEATAYLERFQMRDNQLLSMKADIAKYKDNVALIDFALEKFNSVDILVANAGVYGPKGNIEDIDWDDWSDAIDINLKGTVLSCRSVIKAMKEQRHGKIIILSGGGATKPMPFLSAYAVSKAAIVRFSDTLAEEVSEYNIDVNSIAPGALNTRLLDEVLNSGPEKVGEQFYAQSLKQKENGGAPLEKGAGLCVYLASEESNGITGKLISAIWDPWQKFELYRSEMMQTDIYTLKRIVPDDRGLNWPLKENI